MKAQNHFSPSPSRPVILLGIALLLIMVLLSVILRQQDFVPRVGAPSLEASYHVLLTVDALNQNPPQSHWYLPTVSLAGEQDKHISWGATIASATGDYFYTSFYSPAFLAPYTWFKLTGQEPTIVNLARFNVLLGGLSVLFVYLLLVKLLTLNGYGPWCATTGALAACTVGIFGSEALLSHGVLYWSQSLYQPVLACSLYLFFSYLTSKGRRLRLYGALLIGVALIGPLIEWSGFVFNAGLVAILWWNRRSVPQWRPLAIAIIVVTVVATVTIVMHYSLVAGFQASLESFLARFEARSAPHGSLWDLFKGYGVSHGMFFLGTLLFFAAFLFFERMQTSVDRSVDCDDAQRINALLLLAASVPLLENVLLLQHAVEFSFDRLKLIFPLALLTSLLFAKLETRWRVVLLIVITISAFQGYRSYRERLNEYSQWAAVDTANRQLRSHLSSHVDLECAVLYSNIAVRGYSNLLFNRGIYEYRSLYEGMDLLRQRDACVAIFLDAAFVFTDLQQYFRAVVTYPDGSRVVVSHDKVVKPVANELVDSFYQTDPKYSHHGVSRRWPGFYVPNTERFIHKFVPGRRITFADGETRIILGTQDAGRYLEVTVDGDLLDPEAAGVPHEYTVH